MYGALMRTPENAKAAYRHGGGDREEQANNFRLSVPIASSVRENGLSWHDVIRRDDSMPREEPQAPPWREHDVAERIRFAMQHLNVRNDWKRAFIADTATQAFYSPRQLAKIQVLLAKIDKTKSRGRSR
jgi:hypothetical protein